MFFSFDNKMGRPTVVLYTTTDTSGVQKMTLPTY